MRLWDVFDGAGCVETLQHGHDVLALAYRPDGRQLAAATLDGAVSFWDPNEGALQGTIAGRRDARGGALAGDVRGRANADAGAAFTSLAYSADGALLFAAGSSKYVCVYDVQERLLLRKFQITHNRSLDGVLDQLSAKGQTDAGPLELIDHDGADDADELLPPTGAGLAAEAGAAVGAAAGAGARKRPAARVRALALSPTGQSWAAATTEGVLLYALDAGAAFDPTDLAEGLTPAAFDAALGARAHVRALLIALRLGDAALVKRAALSTPPAQVEAAARALPAVYLEQLLRALAALLSESPHLEFLLRWVRAVAVAHGPALQQAGAGAGAASAAAAGGGARVGLPVLRALQQALARAHADLAGAAEGNAYTLEYLVAASKAHAAAEAKAARDAAAAAKGKGGGAGGAGEGGSDGEEEDGGEGAAARRCKARAGASGKRRRGGGGGGGGDDDDNMMED